jgi:hypothetical protein
MADSIPVTDLEIVGYATALKESMLPSIVPPVFRLKSNANLIRLPPYIINNGILCNSTEVAASELKALENAQEVTLFEHPFAARCGYDLLVTNDFRWSYLSRKEARDSLNKIASEHVERAKSALAERNLTAAEKSASIAISANDRLVEPLAVKAAIRRLKGDKSGYRLMKRLAEDLISASGFDELIEAVARGYKEAGNFSARSQQVSNDLFSSSPMCGVAALRAA